MEKYCRICGCFVESEGHTHPEKVCEVCHQTKKLAEFPLHPSSMDGHKHTCIICDAAKKELEKACRVQFKIEERQRQEQERIQRAKDNTLFRAYGYRWKKEMVPEYDAWVEGWVLYTPTGEQTSKNDALQEIAKLQVHKPGHPSTLWAKDILSRPNVLVLDTETTGFSDDDEIIDIALVDKEGHIRLNTLVQCQQEAIPNEATAIHRIHKNMLCNAPTFPQLWSELIRLLSTHEILIYNAEYDVRMLRQAAKRYNLKLPEIRVHCLMKQYSSYVGQTSLYHEGYRNQKLAVACLHFQIEQTNSHRALPDAQVSLQMLRKLAALAVVPSLENCNTIPFHISKPR